MERVSETVNGNFFRRCLGVRFVSFSARPHDDRERHDEICRQQQTFISVARVLASLLPDTALEGVGKKHELSYVRMMPFGFRRRRAVGRRRRRGITRGKDCCSMQQCCCCYYYITAAASSSKQSSEFDPFYVRVPIDHHQSSK